MKNITKSFILFILVLPYLFSNAQVQTVQVGSGSSYFTSAGPIYSWFKKSRFAYIYKDTSIINNISASDTLKNISFNRNAQTNSMQGTVNMKIYISSTTDNYLNSTLDWSNTISNMELVYNDDPSTIIGNTGGWKQFNLKHDTGWVYNGNNILVLVEYESTSITSPSLSWNVYNTGDSPNYNARKTYSDGTLSNSLTTGSYYLPVIKINYTQGPPMTYDSCTVEQVSGVVNMGDTAAVLKVGVYVHGGQPFFQLSGISFTTTGTDNLSDIAFANVYYTGSSNSFDTINQFGSTVNSPGNSFNVNGSTNLSSGVNYFWLAYKVSFGATLNHKLDATCTQISLSGSNGTKNPSITSPAGNLVIKNQQEIEILNEENGISVSYNYGPIYSVSPYNYKSRYCYIYGSQDIQGIVNNDTILSLGFLRAGGPDFGSIQGNANMKIYVGNTSSIEFSYFGSESWSSRSSSCNLVYNDNPATIIGSSNGWKDFPLNGSDGFVFNNSSGNNLLVMVEFQSDQACDTTINWQSYSTFANQDASTFSTGTLSDNLNTGYNYKSPALKINYLATPMAIDSTIVEQCSAEASVGERNAGILKIGVHTSGGNPSIDLTQFTFNTNGTASLADIDSAKVFYSGSSASIDTTNRYGTAVVNPNGTFTISGNLTLQNGENYFWLAYDINDTLSGSAADAECTQISFSGSTGNVIPTNTAPLGDIPLTNAQVITIGSATSSSYYYTIMYSSNNSNYSSRYAHLFPASYLTDMDVGSLIQSLSFNRKTDSYNGYVNANDSMRIYIGNSSASTLSTVIWSTQIASMTKVFDGSPAQIIGNSGGWKEFPFDNNWSYGTSTDTSLLILIEYKRSQPQTSYIYWHTFYESYDISTREYSTNSVSNVLSYSNSYLPQMQIKFAAPQPKMVSSVIVSQDSTDAGIGVSANVVLKVAVNVSGDITPFSLNQIDFTTTGSTNVSDIVNAKLYYTGTNNAFADSNQFGSTVNSPNGSFSYTASQLVEDTVNYFWLTYDISSSASLGNYVDATCTQLVFSGNGGTKVPSPVSPSGNKEIVAGLDAKINLINPTAFERGGAIDVMIDIINTQSEVIDSVEANFTDGTNTVSQTFLSLNLAQGDTAHLTFSTPWSFSSTSSFRTYISKVNSSLDINPYNDTTVWITVTPSLIGDYYINPNVTANDTTFNSFTAAINFLGTGTIGGHIRFNVSSGTYNEQLVINQMATSSDKTISFKSLTGDSTDVILQYSNTSSSDNYVVQLNETDHIIFQNMTITTPNSYSNYIETVFEFKGQSDYNIIRNCRIISPNWGTSYSAYRASPIFFNSHSDSTIIENNVIKHGKYGIYSYYAENTIIRNNEISGQAENCIYVYSGNYSDYDQIIGNTMNADNDYVIEINNPAKKMMISKNQIYGLNGGIFIQHASTDTVEISNNFISIQAGEGIRNNSVMPMKIVFNSIFVYGSGSSYGCINPQTNTTTPYMVVKNNILFNNIGHLIYNYYGNSHQFINCDYNCYYTPPSNQYFIDNTSSLSTWQTNSGKDAHSVSINPQFTSNQNLHLTGTLLNGIGTPINGITTDIDNELRDISTPDIGADEIFLPNNNAALVRLAGLPYCQSNSGLKVLVRNEGELAISNLQIEYVINDTTQPIITNTTTLASGDSIIIQLGNYNFIPGQSYNLKVYIKDVNSVTDEAHGNDTLNFPAYKTAISGQFTIGGTGADYSTITAAVNDLEAYGICGNVVFNIASGTYTEQLNIGAILGATGNNYVTFQSATNDSANVTIQHSIINSDDYVIKIANASNIILKHLTVKLQPGLNGSTVLFENAQNCELNNCLLIALGSSPEVVKLVQTKETVIESCILLNSSYSVNVINNSSNQMSGKIVITNNLITDFSSTGINVEYQDSVKIIGNTIKSNSTGSLNGMYLFFLVYADIVGNRIYFNATTDASGINGFYISSSTQKRSLIANNFITTYMSRNWGSSECISLYNSTNVDIYHNSLYSQCLQSIGDNYKGNSYALYVNGSGISVKNNIIKGDAYLLGYPSVTGITSSDYNAFIASSSTLFAKVNNTNVGSLPALKTTTSMDANSVTLDPLWQNDSALYITNTAFDSLGIPVAEVTVDIDGEPRNTNKPDIGADEFALFPNNSAVIGMDFSNDCEGTSVITAQLKNFGTSNLTSAIIKVEVNGVLHNTYSWAGSVSYLDTSTFVVDTIQSSSTNSYNIKVYSILPNGVNDPQTYNDTNTVVRTFYPLPTVTLSPQSGVCLNSNLTLSGGQPANGYYSGLGVNAGIFNSSTTGVGSQTVYYAYTDANGCTDSSMQTIEVYPLPFYSLGKDTSFCYNDSLVLKIPSLYNSTWSTMSILDSIIVDTTGIYYATIVDSNQCQGYTDSLSVTTVLPYDNQELCIVGVDSASNSNYIIWEKTANAGIASFNIYKESTISNVYTLLSNIPYNNTNEYIDTSSNPSVKAESYKISIIDSCGNESPLSPMHKTMHLTINQGMGNTWNLIWSKYEGFQVSTYRIWRGLTPNSMVLLDSVSGSSFTYTDLNPPTGGLFYQVEIISPNSCSQPSPSLPPGIEIPLLQNTNYNSSRSNVANNGLVINSNQLSVNVSATDTTVCQGAATQLSANVVGGNGIYSYSWYSSNSTLIGNTQSITVNPTQIQFYKVIVVYGVIAKTDSLQISVIPTNPVSFTGLISDQCINGNDVSLTANPTGGVFTGDGIVNNVFSPSLAGLGNHTVTYSLLDANNCTVTQSQIVNVHQTPNVSLSGLGTYCSAENPVLLSGGIPNGGTYTGNGVSNGYFDPVSAGVGKHLITYSYYDSYSCLGVATDTISVVQGVSADAGNNISINHGTITTLNGSSNGGSSSISYSWSPAELVLNPSSAITQTKNLSSTTVFTLNVTDNNSGCTSSSTVTVTVTGSALSVNLPSTDSICMGDTLSLNALASGGDLNYSYSWSSNPLGFISSSPGINVVPAANTTYKVIVNDGYNTDTAEISVTLLSLPTASFTGLALNYCYNDFEDTLVPNFSNYNFTGSGIAGNVFNPSLAGNGLHNITLTVFDSNQCSDSYSQFVNVYAPTNISFTLPSSICYADTLNLNIATPSGGSYSGSGVQSSYFLSNIAGHGSHELTYTYVDANNCTYSATDTIVVNPLPSLTISSLSDICENTDSILLNNAMPAGGTYSGTAITNSYFNPAIAGIGSHIVYYDYTDNNSCHAQMSDTINVLNTVYVSTLPSSTINYGTTANLTANLSGNQSNCITWWMPQSMVVNPDSLNTTSLNLYNNQVFEIVALDTVTQCSDTAQHLVNINGIPLSISISSQVDSICYGDSIYITSISSGGSGNYSYSWYSNSTLFSNNSDVTVAPATSSTYYCVINDGYNSDTDYVFVEVLNLPNPVIYGLDSMYCSNDQADTLYSTFVNSSYIGTGMSGNIFDPSLAGNGVHSITLTVIDSFGCANSIIDTVLVNDLPAVTLSNLQDICLNSSNLSLSGGYPLNGIYSGSGVVSGIFNPSAAGIGEHEIMYTYTDSNMCSNYALDTITVNDLPLINLGNDTTICKNHVLTLDAGSNYSSYLWSDNSTLQTLTLDSNVLILGSNIIFIEVTDSNQCTNSDTIIVTMESCSNIESSKNQIIIKVYPNPNKGSFIIEFRSSTFNEEAIINIYSSLGSLIYSESTEIDANLSKQINLKNIAKGVYYLKLTTKSNKTFYSKIIVN